jgi:hypothetical protein
MKWAGNVRTWVRYAVILTLLLGSSLPAWSHNDPDAIVPPTDASSHGGQAFQPQLPVAQSSSPWIPEATPIILLFALIAMAITRSLERWRRLTAFGLVLTLSAFTFGTAVHAVHHLGDPGKAAECLVFSASQHVSGTLDEPCHLYALVVAVKTTSRTNHDGPVCILRCGTDLPRAPPASFS